MDRVDINMEFFGDLAVRGTALPQLERADATLCDCLGLAAATTGRALRICGVAPSSAPVGSGRKVSLSGNSYAPPFPVSYVSACPLDDSGPCRQAVSSGDGTRLGLLSRCQESRRCAERSSDPRHATSKAATPNASSPSRPA